MNCSLVWLSLFILFTGILARTRKTDVLSVDRENLVERTAWAYPVNNCSYHEFPRFVVFVDSYCIERADKKPSWAMYCTTHDANELTGFLLQRGFIGHCREGYICENEAPNNGLGPSGQAWCRPNGTTSETASSNGLGPSNGSGSGGDSGSEAFASSDSELGDSTLGDSTSGDSK